MNELDETRDTDRQGPAAVRQFDLDDDSDPWAAWDDIGGEG
jgi:hypothetical protein